MFKPAAGLAAALLLVLSAAPVAAQGSDVHRQVFTFLGRGLVIDVDVDAPGELRIVRGQRGRVEVAARAQDGFTAASLAKRGGDRLSLTAMGGERVEYLVAVPSDIRVQVRLPDRHVSEVFGSLQSSSRYTWGAAEGLGPETRGAFTDAAPTGRFSVHSAATAPRSIRLANPAAIRTVTVRWEGDRFDVTADRHLDLLPGSSQTLEIAPNGAPLDLVLSIPRGTRDFVLEVGGATALVLRGGQVTTLCTPLMDQRLDGGRRWFTFTPQHGRLECEGSAAPARRGA
jgi:hypothetical protein